MNDVTDQTADAEVNQEDALAALKAKADRMGIKYHPSIGADSLRAKVNAALNDTPTTPDEAAPASAVVEKAEETPAQAAARFRKECNAEARKLVRLRIANLNPEKKDLNGEYITTGNRFVGDIKRFVPFGEATENGWHVEQMIYDILRTRRFLQVKVRRDARDPNQQIVDQRWVPEFALDVLPQLTPKEIRDLATAQAAGNHID